METDDIVGRLSSWCLEVNDITTSWFSYFMANWRLLLRVGNESEFVFVLRRILSNISFAGKT